MVANDYPKHLTEPQRLRVAYSLIEHEFKKLFPNLVGCGPVWKSVTDSISSWQAHPEKHNLARTRDFWNGFDGIMSGFKLKELVKFVSAENIEWQRTKSFPIEELRFGSLVGVLKKGYDSDQQQNPTAGEVRKWLSENLEARTEADASSKTSFKNCEARIIDPIVVEKKRPNGGSESCIVHDGNGRLLKKILDGEQQIDVFLGEFVNNQPPTNYWVSTAYLIKIREGFHRDENDDRELVAMYQKIYSVSQSESMKKELPRALEGWPEEKIENLKRKVFGAGHE